MRRVQEDVKRDRLRVVKGRFHHEESRNNFMKDDDDSPKHMTNRRSNNDDETKRMEDLRGKGGGRLKHCTVDGNVQLCLRKKEKDSNDDSSSKGKTREEKGKRKQHSKQNEALCHEQNGERKRRYLPTFY